MNKSARNQSTGKGFTLIELIVVIGVLSILFAITLVAINPARQFQQARDTQRRSDVTAILNAVGQYYIDNKQLPPGVDGTNKEISTSGANLCAQLVTLYLAALPADPSLDPNPIPYPCPGTYNTGYFIQANGDRITVSATSELNPADPIEVTR